MANLGVSEYFCTASVYDSDGQPGALETKFGGPRLFQNTILWGSRVSDCNTKWARIILV